MFPCSVRSTARAARIPVEVICDLTGTCVDLFVARPVKKGERRVWNAFQSTSILKEL